MTTTETDELPMTDSTQSTTPLTTSGEARARSADALRGVKALLVEDSPFNQKIGVKMLSRAGCSVTVACNGEQCLRVLARFGGDLDKTVAALVRFHERKQQRHPAANDNKTNNGQQQKQKRPDSAQLEALHEQRQARRAERLAARLARQEQKKQHQDSNVDDDTVTAKKRFDAASVESLVALMADLGLAVAKGRCRGALRRADGDVDAAKAELVDWCTKRQERQHNNDDQTARAPIEDQETAEGDDTDKKRLLAQLDQMGFGVPNGSTDKEAERIRRRNERLLKRFNGDVEQVASLLKARSAKVEERTAARKARQVERPRARRCTAQATEEKAKAEYEKIADRRVRLGLVLSEIGEKNKITVTDDEVSRALIDRARQSPGREKEVWDFYRNNPNALAQLRAPIYEDKVVDFILELANVTEKKVTRDDLLKEEEDKTAA